jgi:hypothetical protein
MIMEELNSYGNKTEAKLWRTSSDLPEGLSFRSKGGPLTYLILFDASRDREPIRLAAGLILSCIS